MDVAKNIKLDNIIKENDIIDTNDKNFNKLMLIYSIALRKTKKQIEIIDEELKKYFSYNIINKIETRIKTPNSIINKMKNKNFECTYQNLINNINDIAGLRIVCYSIEDIFFIKSIIEKLPELKILKEKDYITHPKKSGYSSYHIILEQPINILYNIINIKVEIQIRTIKMDTWANTEHKLKYKPFLLLK